jgi:hypothetical protein
MQEPRLLDQASGTIRGLGRIVPLLQKGGAWRVEPRGVRGTTRAAMMRQSNRPSSERRFFIHDNQLRGNL